MGAFHGEAVARCCLPYPQPRTWAPAVHAEAPVRSREGNRSRGRERGTPPNLSERCAYWAPFMHASASVDAFRYNSRYFLSSARFSSYCAKRVSMV
jgi:hypothetical protein